MTQGTCPDHFIDKWLEVLRISHLSEWDVLMFLSSHGASLASVEHISRLIGYSKTEVANALDKLESNGLAQRSRVSHGVRFYELVENPDRSLKRCMEELTEEAEKRNIRVRVAKRLQRSPSMQPTKRTSR